MSSGRPIRLNVTGEASHPSARRQPAAPIVDGLWRLPMDQFVIWTGQAHRGAASSRIGECVAAIEDIGPWMPAPLRALYQRVAASGRLLTPDEFKTALRLHQRACPAVLVLARRSGEGGWLAAYDIPMGMGGGRHLQAGAVIPLDRFDAASTPSRRYG